jgi:hypothetical protein
MNYFRHLLVIVRQARAGNRVSVSAYIKGHERIEMGRGCKIHSGAWVAGVPATIRKMRE